MGYGDLFILYPTTHCIYLRGTIGPYGLGRSEGYWNLALRAQGLALAGTWGSGTRVL